MNLSARRQGNAFVMSIQEPRIDAALAIQFKDIFRDRTRTVKGRIVLDLQKVDFVDSSGLGAIIACMKNLAEDQKLELSGLNPAVAKVFSLTRMNQVFTIYKTLDQAVDGVGV